MSKLFDTLIDLSIKSNYHDQCLAISKIVKKYCDSWHFCSVKYTQSKSARKGNVLNRYFMIYQTATSDDILIFKEGLSVIMREFALMGIVDISIRFTKPLVDSVK